MGVRERIGNVGTWVMVLLTAVFAVLKLCGVVTWSWIWVLTPIWGCMALGLSVFILLIISIVIRVCIKHIGRKKNE